MQNIDQSRKKLPSYDRSILKYLFILAGLNILLLFVPLFNVFGYEFSAINGLFITILFGFFTLNIYNNKPEIVSNKLFILSAFLFLIVPVIISIVYSLIYGFCSVKDGLLFYFTLTFPAVFIGFTIALIPVLLMQRFRWIPFIIIIFIVALIPVYEIYFFPQIYFFNPLVGFFPGTIYDEGLTVDRMLVIYRILNLLYFGISGLIFVKLIKESYLIKLSFIFAFFLIGFSFIFFSDVFGFSTTESRIKNSITKEIETGHFNIQYSDQLELDYVKYILLSHEYYYLTNAEFFGVSPSEKIKSFIFESREQKRELFGAGSADVSKPWLDQIYLSEESWEGTLEHEIAHIFTSEFGTTPFEVANWFNPSLIEGFAEASSPFYNENYLHYLTLLGRKNGYDVDLTSLFSGLNFFTHNSSIGYIYSGSFILYLQNNYETYKLRKLYSSNDFKESYGITFDVLYKEYLEYLYSLNFIGSSEKADYYFGRQSIFQKVCPRYLSDRIREGWENISNNDLEKAKNLFNEVLQKRPVYSAILGLSEIYTTQDKVRDGIELIARYENDFQRTAYYYNIQLLKADLLSRTGSPDSAKTIYRYIENLRLSYTMTNLAITRLDLLRNGLLTSYLDADSEGKYKILRKLNYSSYSYASFPTLLYLADLLDKDYSEVKRIFNKTLSVNSSITSYALYSLSSYMLSHLDYTNARKMAGLSRRFTRDNNLAKLTERNFEKAEWFYYNADQLLEDLFK